MTTDDKPPPAGTPVAGGTPFRVFVAMPGKMGPNSPWKNVEQIKTSFYGRIRADLETALGRPVSIVIEVDKAKSGVIHASMFREARDADAYIVDLSGANPNVYLETGVRWSYSNGPTVLVCQNQQHDVRFNVQLARVFPYDSSYSGLVQAVGQIVQAIVDGLAPDYEGDSPVLAVLPPAVVPRGEYDAVVSETEDLQAKIRELQAEIKQLQAERAERAEGFIQAAKVRDDPDDQIELLQKAVTLEPWNAEAHFQCGLALLDANRNSEAATSLERATEFASERGDCWHQLGVAWSRTGEPGRAEEAFDKALQFNPNNAHAWASRGGNLRRLARGQRVKAMNWELMAKARESYEQASRIRKYDSYIQLNLRQLELLLSRGAPDARQRAQQGLRQLENLVNWELDDKETARDVRADTWNRLKLLTILALTGRHDEAIAKIDWALERNPAAARPAFVEPTVEPLKDISATDGLEPETTDGLERFIAALEQRSQP
jgi:tetratricopeptide (TPR) repeat protein